MSYAPTPYPMSDVSDLTSELAAKMASNGLMIFEVTTQKSPVKVLGKQGTVSSGQVVLYLTDTGLAGGNALFTNVYPEFFNFFVNDSTTSWLPSYGLSGDKKTLTITVNKPGQAYLSLLGFNILTAATTTAPNGTVVNVVIWGD